MVVFEKKLFQPNHSENKESLFQNFNLQIVNSGIDIEICASCKYEHNQAQNSSNTEKMATL